MLAEPIRPPLINSTTSQYKQYFAYRSRLPLDPYRDKARTAGQVRDELQNRMAKIAADVPGALRVRIPLPERHPPDASGRNWNIVPLNDLGADCAHHVQKVIEDMRTEFVLPD